MYAKLTLNRRENDAASGVWEYPSLNVRWVGMCVPAAPPPPPPFFLPKPKPPRLFIKEGF